MQRYDGKNQLERLGRGVGLQANFRYMAGLAATGDTRYLRQRVVGAKPRIVTSGNRASLGEPGRSRDRIFQSNISRHWLPRSSYPLQHSCCMI